MCTTATASIDVHAEARVGSAVTEHRWTGRRHASGEPTGRVDTGRIDENIDNAHGGVPARTEAGKGNDVCDRTGFGAFRRDLGHALVANIRFVIATLSSSGVEGSPSRALSMALSLAALISTTPFVREPRRHRLRRARLGRSRAVVPRPAGPCRTSCSSSRWCWRSCSPSPRRRPEPRRHRAPGTGPTCERAPARPREVSPPPARSWRSPRSVSSPRSRRASSPGCCTGLR
jgi:hypothetical protein